jgi:uncharacterized OsmC-like protein
MLTRTVKRTHPASAAARRRQTALRAWYGSVPAAAWTTHLAWTESGAEMVDPFAGQVRVGLWGHPQPFALDDRGGSPALAPAPGEFMCAALAACVDAAIRLEAAERDLPVERLVVIAKGDVDGRGALGVGDVPVGFQSMRLELELRLAPGIGSRAAAELIAAATSHSPALQTLRAAVPIEIVVKT